MTGTERTGHPPSFPRLFLNIHFYMHPPHSSVFVKIHNSLGFFRIQMDIFSSPSKFEQINIHFFTEKY